MKTLIQITFTLILLSQAYLTIGQCGIVEPNTFVASPVDNFDGTFTWTIEFIVCNHSGAGNSSLKYGLIAEDPGKSHPDTLNYLDDVCDACNIVYPGRTITNTYIGGEDAIFFLDWQGYADPECHGNDVCAVGSETTQEPAGVELIHFSGAAEGTKVKLEWATETENNNSHFEIQRSEDGRSFTQVGQVAGQGTTEVKNYYSYTDYHPISKAYYRLKQVDFDGTYNHSDMINVVVDFSGSKLQVYPTYSKGEVTIRLANVTSNKANLRVVSQVGQVLLNKDFNSSINSDYIIFYTGEYPSGLYYVIFTDRLGTKTSKFIVLNDHGGNL